MSRGAGRARIRRKQHFWNQSIGDEPNTPGKWVPKASWPTEEEAKVVCLNLLGLTGKVYVAYMCWCGEWHVRYSRKATCEHLRQACR